MMICCECLEDFSGADIAYSDGELEFCYYCWPMIKERFLKQKEHYEKIGHTGTDLCGCSMCAAKWDRD